MRNGIFDADSFRKNSKDCLVDKRPERKDVQSSAFEMHGKMLLLGWRFYGGGFLSGKF